VNAAHLGIAGLPLQNMGGLAETYAGVGIRATELGPEARDDLFYETGWVIPLLVIYIKSKTKVYNYKGDQETRKERKKINKITQVLLAMMSSTV